MRLSFDGPNELKYDTVSMSAASSAKDVSPSPSAFVNVYRVSPDDDDPTASTFFPMDGLPIVHEVLSSSPSFPAAKISRCSGFCIVMM